ncbi:MAG: hypothetical protein E5W82_05305 [Mesorhizobium sp.]|nr:MAG: hypothetical protein E5W82_05305 [Mesorhizobium sp.]
MGFASKLEDEIERRGGEWPRLTAGRHNQTIEALIPELKPAGLDLDGPSTDELNRLLEKLSLSQLLIAAPAERATLSGKQLGKSFKLLRRYTDDATAVIHFLAPRIRNMRAGPQKRSWQKRLTRFQKSLPLKLKAAI